jgi:lysophospholipase L1-like esterase
LFNKKNHINNSQICPSREISLKEIKPMSRLTPSLIAIMLFAARSVAADGPTPFPEAKNEKAWPGVGPIRTFGWMVENRAHFWKQRDKDQGAVIFVGDSLTGGWDNKKLAAAFPKLKVANRGIGGDVSRGLLFRFQEDVLDLKPRAIVLCIGTNDLSAHADPAGIAKNIAALLDQAIAADPQRPIVLCTIPPRDHKDAPTKPGALADINARIKKLAEERSQVTLLDLYAWLSDEGKLVDQYFAQDRLHLAAAGYDRWAEALTPIFGKLELK